jgi:hypothetical protein
VGDPAAVPERPPSEAEWEDLLVRYEIAPRAARIAVEDAPGAPAPDALGRLVAGEYAARAALEAMREGRPLPDDADVGREEELTARGAADLFASLRARNFATLQRRGIDVWAWSAEDGSGGRMTPYRLLSAAVAMDARALAELRSGEGAR